MWPMLFSESCGGFVMLKTDRRKLRDQMTKLHIRQNLKVRWTGFDTHVQIGYVNFGQENYCFNSFNCSRNIDSILPAGRFLWLCDTVVLSNTVIDRGHLRLSMLFLMDSGRLSLRSANAARSFYFMT